MIFVTGGAGFIGANFVLDWISRRLGTVLVIDKLTYAGNLANLQAVRTSGDFAFRHLDICDRDAVLALMREYRPSAVVHFAAETHVDRSIAGPGEFVRTNITGTFALLDAARVYWEAQSGEDRERFRFLQVSTDEVYGSLAADEPPFAESARYRPNSPYAASKAAADHLVRAYHRSFGLPTLTTNCGNNFGPFQFPEKLIPLMILSAIEGKPLPVYGDGKHIRDWLYVADHCSAIRAVLERGRTGEVYNIGGDNPKQNIEVVETICALLDEKRPRPTGRHAEQIIHVEDRPGHDRRYAIDARKIETELGWRPAETFESAIRNTVDWYLREETWVAGVRSGAYRDLAYETALMPSSSSGASQRIDRRIT